MAEVKAFSADNSLREMLTEVARSREVVSGETKTEKLIEQALNVLHESVVNLYLEKAHVYQLTMMTERDKPKGKRDKRIIKDSILNWEKTLNEAAKYVKSQNLKQWQSRIERYRGRLEDARGRHVKAIGHYKKAVRTAKLDPEFADAKVPRWLEVEGFLASAYIYSGQVKKGWNMSQKIYQRFDSREAAGLKKKDYSTWAIWKSGIPIRIGQALRIKRFKFDRETYKKWLDDAQELLTPPPGVKVWVDFGFRKNEIAAIKRELGI